MSLLINTPKPILVTGAAGFIGANVSRALLGKGCEVIGIDNLNDYYEPALKEHRLQGLRGESRFSFRPIDIADAAAVNALFDEYQFDIVIHLAAQAGVRYSIENPQRLRCE